MQGLRLKGTQGFVPIKPFVSFSILPLLPNWPPAAAPLSRSAGLAQREASHLVLRSLPLPYSTAITDSLDSQVTHVPLRIQFTGVTQVRLPPLFRGQNRSSLCFSDAPYVAHCPASIVPLCTSCIGCASRAK